MKLVTNFAFTSNHYNRLLPVTKAMQLKSLKQITFLILSSLKTPNNFYDLIAFQESVEQLLVSSQLLKIM